MAYDGPKMGTFNLFGHHKCSGIIFGESHFHPFLTYFWSKNSPFPRHFWVF